jgi:hypothetical protein
MKVILEGITGSQAYGLAHEDSDTDMHGIFVVPTETVLGINSYQETVSKKGELGDIAMHEVQKYMRLALAANPTILELLWLPEYTIETKEGSLLVISREIFLSKKIYKTYGGYAISQAKRLLSKDMSYEFRSRYEKHVRHCFRLLDQGKQLLETGELQVKVQNREELFELGKLSPEQVYDRFEKKFSEFDKVETKLPDNPNYEIANDILLGIRRENYS